MELWVVNLIGNLFEIIVLNLFFSACCERKFTAKKHYLLNIPILALLFIGTNLFIGKSLFIILSSIICNLTMALLFKCKWHLRFLYALSVWLIIALTEILMMIIFNFHGIDTALTQTDPIYFAIGTILSKIFSLILICILKLFIKKRQYSIKNVFLILPLPVSSALVLAMLMPVFYDTDNLLKFFGISVTTAMLIVANMSIFYFLDKQDDYITAKAKLMFAESQLDAQKEHYKALYNHLNEIKMFRHDMKNRMISLMGLLNKNETGKALQVMQNSLDTLDLQTKDVINSGNPVIDAVLHSKLSDARNNNVQMDCSVKLPYDISVDEIEFGILLGNIIDNAIEASAALSETLRTPIKLSIISTQSNISINVINSTVNDIDTDCPITTKKDAGNHGYGIKIIKAIAEKHNGFADFECKNNVFTTKVNISNSSL